MKKTISLVFPIALSLYAGVAGAVTMNFTGSFRGEAATYNKHELGTGSVNPTKSFVSGRALLNPNLVVDDHFSVKSQWSLLQSPNFTPSGQNGLWPGQGGYVFGDRNTAALTLSRAWLEWTSDFGVFRFGRMPVTWGYGLVYDAGSSVWDDFQSTLDRVEYRLHLGHLIGAVAYSKQSKGSVLGNTDDQEFYTAYLQYDNPEMEVEGGVYFEKQARARTQQDALRTGTGTAGVNPNSLPNVGGTLPPLATNTPYPLSNILLDAYVKKSFGHLTLGGEAGWLTGDAVDFNGNGSPDKLNAFGVMASASYEINSVKLFSELLYASGDANLGADRLNGFVLLHRNRRAGLILGRELLGLYAGNHVGQGSMVAYGDSGTYSGVLYLRPGIRVDWSPSWSTGLEIVYARKAAVTPGAEAGLGFEVDLGAEYAVYKNFDVGLSLGFLLPGKGLGVPNPPTVFGLRTTAALKF